MGLRTWIYKHTGIKLRRFDDPLQIEIQQLREAIEQLKQPDLKNYNKSRDIQIHEQSRVDQNLLLLEHIKIQAHSYAHGPGIIGRYVSIGKYCSIASFTLIAPGQHHTDWLTTYPYMRPNGWDAKQNDPTTIGNDVWIGSMTVIQPGVTIGDGAVIGSGAVVTKDVPPYAIVAGVPAKILRYRFDESTIKELLELKWWDLDPEDMSGVIFSDVHQAIDQIKKIKISEKL